MGKSHVASCALLILFIICFVLPLKSIIIYSELKSPPTPNPSKIEIESHSFLLEYHLMQPTSWLPTYFVTIFLSLKPLRSVAFT